MNAKRLTNQPKAIRQNGAMTFKKLFFLCLFLFFVTSTVALGATPSTVRTGSGTNKMSIYFWPVGYSAGEQGAFESKISYHIGSPANNWSGPLWNNNAIGSLKDRFDVYKVVSVDVWAKTESEIVAKLDDIPGGQFRDSFANTRIDVLIDNNNIGSPETKEVGNESWVYLPANGKGHLLAHEIGVHVIGYQAGFGAQPYSLADEYAGSCGTWYPTAPTMWHANLHDKNSDDKWNHLVTGLTIACDAVYIPTEYCTARHGTNSQNFCPVCSDFIAKGFDKRTTNEVAPGYDVTPPTLTSTDIILDLPGYTPGVTQTVCDQPFTLTATPTDAGTGISRVEFYIKKNNGVYQSLAVDRTPPYQVTIDPTAYVKDGYTLRAVAVDNWNNIATASVYTVFSQTQPVAKSFTADVNGISYPILAKGCTTAYFIDEDCDGYGVGHKYLKGMDADDKDPNINTLSSAEAVYGNMRTGPTATANLKAFLASRKAHSYEITGNVYYISQSSDGTGTINNPDDPYPTFSAVVSLLRPGDLVVYRGGNYDCDTTPGYTISANNIDGAQGSPIVIMGMPGETVILNGTSTTGQVDMSSTDPTDYVTIDSIVFGNTDEPEIIGVRLQLRGNRHVHLRYLEIENGSYLIYTGSGNQTSVDYIIDHCSIHHGGLGNSLNHNIYLVASQEYNIFMQDYKITDNLIYGNYSSNEAQLLHINGPTGAPGRGHLIEGNIFHTAGGKALDFMSGQEGALVRNNLFFNINKQCISIYEYNAKVSGVFRAKNISIINNTFYSGRYNNGIGYTDPAYAAAIWIGNDIDDAAISGIDLINNVFRTYGGYVLYFHDVVNSTNIVTATTHWRDTTYYNNIYHRADGIDNFAIVRAGSTYYNYSMAEFRTLAEPDGANFSGNKFADPKLANVSDAYCSPGKNANCTGYPRQFDLRLTTISPAINSGLSSYGMPNRVPSHDLAGRVRTSFDIGAYEYVDELNPSPSSQEPPKAPTRLIPAEITTK